jgi:hypothetical protein
MIHTQPTSDAAPGSANPTNGVGGLFILNLPPTPNRVFKSHQRSWWLVHTQPTSDAKPNPANPTNGVGGLFILNLLRTALWKSCGVLSQVGYEHIHQLRWWDLKNSGAASE